MANVPLAGLWAIAVLVFAILQLPSVIVILPVIIYLFSAKELLPAILWTIPLLVIALSDNVLKPLLMGKGSTVPMLVIFSAPSVDLSSPASAGCSAGPSFFRSVTI